MHTYIKFVIRHKVAVILIILVSVIAAVYQLPGIGARDTALLCNIYVEARAGHIDG